MQIANIDHSVWSLKHFLWLSLISTFSGHFWNTCFSWCEKPYAAFQFSSTYLSTLEKNIQFFQVLTAGGEQKKKKKVYFPH